MIPFATAIALWLPVAFAGGAPEEPAIEDRLRELEAQVAALQAAARERRTTHFTLPDDVRVRPSGFVDIGFFDAGGDGVAYARDVAHELLPEHADVAWVFTGDPWSNAVNSQGDSADLGLDRTNIARFDPIASGGNPSFLVNTIQQGLALSYGDDVFVETSLSLEPRQGALGSPGDLLDIDLAYIEWVPWTERDLHVFVGKFESTFGMEYRNRKAPDRLGITPSIMARYTVGSPTGLKVRGSVADGIVSWNAAVTNAGVSTEKFSHFYDEVDRNAGKTASGRLGFVVPVDYDLEIGVSGLYGSQDGQPEEDVRAQQIGGDFRLRTGKLWVAAEYMVVDDEGGGLETADSLHAEGGYAEVGWRALPVAAAFVRIDRREALLHADDNLYVSDVVRVTGAVRCDITFNLIAKAEYVHIIERVGPAIADDVLTFSAIARY